MVAEVIVPCANCGGRSFVRPPGSGLALRTLRAGSPPRRHTGRLDVRHLGRRPAAAAAAPALAACRARPLGLPRRRFAGSSYGADRHMPHLPVPVPAEAGQAVRPLHIMSGQAVVGQVEHVAHGAHGGAVIEHPHGRLLADVADSSSSSRAGLRGRVGRARPSLVGLTGLSRRRSTSYFSSAFLAARGRRPRRSPRAS